MRPIGGAIKAKKNTHAGGRVFDSPWNKWDRQCVAAHSYTEKSLKELANGCFTEICS